MLAFFVKLNSCLKLKIMKSIYDVYSKLQTKTERVSFMWKWLKQSRTKKC